MLDTPSEFPAHQPRWPLDAPESLVLLHGPRTSGDQAFKLGLLELVAAGVLRLQFVEQRALLAKRDVAVLCTGPRASAARSPSLDAIFEMYARTPAKFTCGEQPAVAVTDLAWWAARSYGTMAGYVPRAVLPSLVARGLFSARATKIVWIIPSTRWSITPGGEAARADLQRWLDVGQTHFSEWVARDPARASVYADRAGAALFLMPAQFPELGRLRMDSTSLKRAAGAPPTPRDLSATASDAPSFDFWGVQSDVRQGLEAAMRAINTAVDAGLASDDTGWEGAMFTGVGGGE